MAIKVQGTTVVDDSRNIVNVVDANVTGVSTFQNDVNIGIGATVAFFDVSSGNIGINSTSPTATLDVNGNVAIGGSVYDNNNLPGTNGQVLSNVTGFGISWTDAPTGQVNVNEISSGSYYIGAFEGTGSTGQAYIETTNPVILTSEGNVGIGSTQPTATLDVNGTLNVSGVTTISVNSTEDALRITQTGTGSALVVEDSTSPDSTPFEVTSAGDVRVGGDLVVQEGDTSSISHRAFYNNTLWSNDVARFAHASGHSQVAVFGNYFNNTTVGAEVSIVRSYSNNVGSNSAVSTPGAPIGGIKFGASISNQIVQAGFFGAFLSESGTFNDTSKPTDFRFYTNPNGAVIPTEKVRITSEGNVGIGTDNPSGAADPNNTTILNAGIVTANFYYGDGSNLTNLPGGGAAGSDGQVQYNNGGSFGGASAFYYDDVNNRVGIGTTSPTQKLDVNGNVAIGGSIYDNNNSPGTNGQVLSNVTGFGVSWTDAAAGGAGGKWIDAGVGIVTTSSIGVNTTTVVGTANSEGAIQVVGNVALVDGALLTDQNIDADVYIPSGKNGLMIGPTTVGLGVTIDIASGSTLVVV